MIMIRRPGNDSGVNPVFAKDNLVTVNTAQTVTADKTFTGGKVKVTTHLIAPTSVPGSPEDGTLVVPTA